MHDFYNVADPTGQTNRYHVYLSLKVQGPDYVPGSTLPTAFKIDRLVLVRAQPGQTLPTGTPLK